MVPGLSDDRLLHSPAMRPQLRELDFRRLVSADEGFAANLAQRVFGKWSRDPVRSLMGMLHGPRVFAEIAHVGDDRVGFFILSTRVLGRPYGPIANPVTAHLDAIAVTPRLARRGVGRALLLRAERRARSQGAVVMTLMTAVSNIPAQRLFKSAGYLAPMTNPFSYANGEDALEMFKPL